MHTAGRLSSRIGCLTFSLLFLAGCESMGEVGSRMQQGLGNAFRAAAAGQGQATGASGAPGSSPQATAVNPLKGTELDGVFKKFPITNSNKPERWPRVALTVKTATPAIIAPMRPQLSANDCMEFDIRLWTSQTESKRFDNLRMCAPAVEVLGKGVAFRTINLFPRYTVPSGENSTASQRTDGPVQPFYMFPQDIQSVQSWTQGGNGIFYLGAVMIALGYDWDNDFDRRFWVVKAPVPAM